MTQFICYPKCTTCKKAMKWLDDNGIEYKVRDIKEKNPTEKELRRRIEQINKARADYYEFYTGQKWGDRANYDLCINTTNITDIVKLSEAVTKIC